MWDSVHGSLMDGCGGCSQGGGRNWLRLRSLGVGTEPRELEMGVEIMGSWYQLVLTRAKRDSKVQKVPGGHWCKHRKSRRFWRSKHWGWFLTASGWTSCFLTVHQHQAQSHVLHDLPMSFGSALIYSCPKLCAPFCSLLKKKNKTLEPEHAVF